MNDNFYITLPSNSSLHIESDNTTSSFTTYLAERISINGNWQVGLVEFHYPQTINNIYGKNNMIYVNDHKNNTKKTFGISMGFCSIREIIDNINQLDEVRKYFLLELDNQFVKVIRTANVKKENTPIFTLHPDLASILGFETDMETNILDLGRAKRPPQDMSGVPNQIYIYCDIAASQFVGGTRAPLLRIVNVDKHNYSYGANSTVLYENPHYVSLLKQEFETIIIDLRDDTGLKIPFLFGTSCVKLHFKRID